MLASIVRIERKDRRMNRPIVIYHGNRRAAARQPRALPGADAQPVRQRNPGARYESPYRVWAQNME